LSKKVGTSTRLLENSLSNSAEESRSLFPIGPGLSGVTEARSSNRRAQESYRFESESSSQQVSGDDCTLPARTVSSPDRADRSGSERVASSIRAQGPRVRDSPKP